MNPQPFPWHLVWQTTEENIRFLRDGQRFVQHHLLSEHTLTRLAELVHAPVEAHLGNALVGPPTPRKGVAVAFERSGRDQFVVIVDSALAASAVMRTMKRQPPPVVDPSRCAPAALAGAFAAILIAASRESIGPLSIVWCGDGSDLSAAGLPDSVVDLSAMTLLDGEPFETHVYVAEDLFKASPNLLFTSADLIALGALPISLSVVASAATAPLREVDSLKKDDVWLPERFLARALSGNFFGDVVLASPTSDRGVRARLADDGSLVLVEGAEELSMTEKDAIVGNAGDAPVVVRVEVGSVTLTAREWSALQAGDVISTKNKISDPVVLRVGGVEVARGELVSVDGHVGVRIDRRS